MRTGNLFGNREHFQNRKRKGERRIFHKRDHLVRHRRNDPLDHLRQNDLEERLRRGITEHARGFILSDRHRFNSAAVNFREIGGVIQRKCNDHRNKAVAARQGNVEKVIRSEKTDQKLKHKRSSAHNRNVYAEHIADDAELRHPAERDKKSKREGEYKCQHKNLH